MKGVVPISEDKEPFAWTLDGERIALEIDTRVYSIEAILKASYKFTDRLFAFIAPAGGSETLVRAVLAGKNSTTALAPIIGDFMNELADQQLRIKLEGEFGTIRSLIVAEAFAAGRPLELGPDDDDYIRDPHGAGSRR